MSELLSQFWTEQMQTALNVVVVLLIILYILSIVWVVRDAYLRGTLWYIWGIVALVPILGLIAYCMLAPGRCFRWTATSRSWKSPSSSGS